MANLIDVNIKQLTITIVCVHTLDVVIFPNIIPGISMLLRRLCIVCLLSRIGDRGKGTKYTCCLECITFTTFGFLQGSYITAVTEPHACVQRILGASCVHKQDRYTLYSEYL